MCVKSHRLKKQNHNGLPPARERGYWGPQGPRLDTCIYIYIYIYILVNPFHGFDSRIPLRGILEIHPTFTVQFEC